MLQTLPGMDLFVVPTIGFDLLYAFVIVPLGRRELIRTNVTANPTAEWVARQITEAFPWNEAPRYMIPDRDRIYGAVATRRLIREAHATYDSIFPPADLVSDQLDKVTSGADAHRGDGVSRRD